MGMTFLYILQVNDESLDVTHNINLIGIKFSQCKMMYIGGYYALISPRRDSILLHVKDVSIEYMKIGVYVPFIE